MMWGARDRVAELAAAQSAQALANAAATSAALRAHMDACDRRTLEAERRADQRDVQNRTDANEWRKGLGERLDHQDDTMRQQRDEQLEATRRLQATLVKVGGAVLTLAIGLIGWLIVQLLNDHGMIK